MRKKLDLFTRKLLEWNQVHNLTGAKTIEEVEANIADSLKPLEFLEGDFEQALDVGTGAGFPGLVLAIAMPKTHWRLVEPRKKRAAFLNYIKSLLDLANVEVKMARIEEIEPFEAHLITSRAVMKTKDLIDLTKPFIAPQTTLLFYKGSEVEKELEKIENYRLVDEGRRKYLILKGVDIV